MVLNYIFAGIALGSIYAIAASGIVVTYVSSGVLNFAFGSLAYFLARFFYFLNTQHDWALVPAFVVAVFLAGPALGAFLYFVLFRHLRLSTHLIRIVATIGVSVALPPLALTLFGNDTITTAPGLAKDPVRTFHMFDAVVGLDQVIAFGCVLTVVVLGTIIMRFTDLGLKVRAMVDSEAMTSLSGVNPSAIAVGVWMVTTTLAGLAGVLAAPTNGLTPEAMTALMAVAFSAVVAARLRSLAGAVTIAMGMGVLTDVSQKYLPENSSLTNALLVSIPFFVMGLFLIVYVGSNRDGSVTSSSGGALDNAIRPLGGADTATAASTKAVVQSRSGWSMYMLGPVIIVALVGVLPLLLSGYWLTLLASGFAFAVVFLSFTMVVGEGGMIWLCQASFAGIGAIATAWLAATYGLNPLFAVFVAALVAVPFGLLIGLLTIRLGNLYVALVTLTIGLLLETLLFTRNVFYNDGLGVAVYRPAFIADYRSFAYVVFAVFVVLALLVVNLRRSTTGLALAAVRFSEPGARTMGLNVVGMKLLVTVISTYIAAVGGGLLALNYEVATPQSYATFAGLVWLAVFVTIGLRSTTAAILAGISFAMLPGVFQTYLSVGWGNLPTMLFGVGAILVAKNPDGQVAMNARQLQVLLLRLRRPDDAESSSSSGHGTASPTLLAAESPTDLAESTS